MCTHAATAAVVKRKKVREQKFPHGSYLIKKDLFNVIFFGELCVCLFYFDHWVAPLDDSSFILSHSSQEFDLKKKSVYTHERNQTN